MQEVRQVQRVCSTPPIPWIDTFVCDVRATILGMHDANCHHAIIGGPIASHEKKEAPECSPKGRQPSRGCWLQKPTRTRVAELGATRGWGYKNRSEREFAESALAAVTG